MTFAAPDPIASTVPYRITEISVGRAPTSLEDFIGDTEFTIDGPTGRHQIAGVGTFMNTGVRFHEKDMAQTGKDVRVWQLSHDPTEGFTAQHTAAT